MPFLYMSPYMLLLFFILNNNINKEYCFKGNEEFYIFTTDYLKNSYL